MLLTGKLLHPSSELEAERWLKENSGARELYQTKEDISRYRLYNVAGAMYQNKGFIEKELYNNLCNLFSGRSKIVIYDLTNMYFTGQMQSSKKAQFGRSKQKQTGSRLIGLALSIDSLGFVRYSKFYNGNISEPETFENMLSDVVCQLDTNGEKPIVVMDAGIATEDNLKIIRGNKYNYDYVCVSRSIPKNYNKLDAGAGCVTDNRGNEIKLTKATVEGKEDNFLHIKSNQKFKKEESIDNKLTQRLEAQLQDIKDKLPKKRTLKKTEKVHEKVGGIKAKLSKIGWLYTITYTEDMEKGIVTDINWHRVKEKEKPKGEYFLRYTNDAITETDVWDVYNMTRDVEAVFRCLKTDLGIRPIHHQKDKYIEPHLWLGILAYQIVNYTRKQLKENNIDYSWTTIVEKMRSMQSSIVSVNNKENQKIYIKLCTRPTKDQKQIFDSHGFKHRPYIRKTKVVPQL
ncbi:MAG: IS1634 family transposase [Prolixibacteraceae bacterium]|nr:IS1634 family transposase [Prolixibacteraceae bacterium]